jgi:hypothetical protein
LSNNDQQDQPTEDEIKADQVPNPFDNLGKVVAQISMDDIVGEVQRRILNQPRIITVDVRVADTLDDINKTLGDIAKLLKPWAEREKRKNIIEQDPDYLAAIVKQVQNDRKTRRITKPKGKMKRK